MGPDINHGRCSIIVMNIIIFVISRSTFRSRRGGRVGRDRRRNESFTVDTLHERMQVSVLSPVQVRDELSYLFIHQFTILINILQFEPEGVELAYDFGAAHHVSYIFVYLCALCTLVLIVYLCEYLHTTCALPCISLCIFAYYILCMYYGLYIFVHMSSCIFLYILVYFNRHRSHWIVGLLQLVVEDQNQ